jgi:hypothetical protein
MAGKDKARMQRSITRALDFLVTNYITALVSIILCIGFNLFRGI